MEGHSPLLTSFLTRSVHPHPLSLLHHSFCRPVTTLGVCQALGGRLGITASPWESSLGQGILSRVMSTLMGRAQRLGWWEQGVHVGAQVEATAVMQARDEGREARMQARRWA